MTEYEAYFATKQAIYCALGKRNSSQFTGLNSKGNKVVEAIAKLEDIGLNGTETRKDANLEIDTSGSFVEDGEYYSQTYTVTSTVDILGYQIDKITDFPSGSFIADSRGSKKTSFSNGDTFKIMIPKSELTQNINGSITVSSKCKTYPVFVGKTRIADTQNYALTCDAYEDFTTTTFFANNGKVQVVKIDAENSKPIEGVEFQLIAEDGTQVGTAKTNSEGIATFSKLYPGEYKLMEISTTNNYILNSEVFNIKVEYNGTTTKSITNYPKKGNLKINKTDIDTSEPISDVTFQLLDMNNNIVATGTTDENGELTFYDLRIGKYNLKETATNPNYVLNTEVFEVEVEYNKTVTKDITNEYKKGNIKINKNDNETSQGIEGVTFQLLDLNENVIETTVTKLKIREVKTLENYQLLDEIKIVELKENEITSVIFENEKIPDIPEEIEPDVPEEKMPDILAKKVEKKLPKTGF